MWLRDGLCATLAFRGCCLRPHPSLTHDSTHRPRMRASTALQTSALELVQVSDALPNLFLRIDSMLRDGDAYTAGSSHEDSECVPRQPHTDHEPAGFRHSNAPSGHCFFRSNPHSSAFIALCSCLTTRLKERARGKPGTD